MFFQSITSPASHPSKKFVGLHTQKVNTLTCVLLMSRHSFTGVRWSPDIFWAYTGVHCLEMRSISLPRSRRSGILTILCILDLAAFWSFVGLRGVLRSYLELSTGECFSNLYNLPIGSHSDTIHYFSIYTCRPIMCTVYYGGQYLTPTYFHELFCSEKMGLWWKPKMRSVFFSSSCLVFSDLLL